MGSVLSCCKKSQAKYRNGLSNDGLTSHNHANGRRIEIQHNVAPYECIPPAVNRQMNSSHYSNQTEFDQQQSMFKSQVSSTDKLLQDQQQPLFSTPNHLKQTNGFASNTIDSKYSTIRPLDTQVYQFMDYPFLTSMNVIKWLSCGKTLFVMRGASGSGKSTIVDCLKDKFSSAVICTRDNFFGRTPDGAIQWDKSREQEADNWLNNQIYQTLESGRTPVIIDEPHTRCWEYKYSVELAGKFDYLVLMVLPKTPWRFEPDQLHDKSTRHEPLWEIERVINQFEPAIPLYFGWFLSDADSDDILQYSSDILEYMINLQEIRIGLASACELPEFVSKEDLLDHWQVKADRLHVTTKFCGYGTVADSETYLRSGAVQESLGQLFPIHIKGFLLTPRTFSGHVQLGGPKQIQLWAADDQEDCGGSGSGGLASGSNSRAGSLSKKTGGLVAKLTNSGGSGTSKPQNRRPFGCRANINLMYAEGVRPVQSALDQLQIIDLQLANSNSKLIARIDTGSIIDWGHGRYYLELNQPIVCHSLFTGQY